ncbi:MAG: DUF378 domain-containing protein [Candidatus Paceibacterota bacterium]
MNAVHMVAFILLVVGGLNWLAVGALGWDLGDLFGGQDAMISRVIYILVGLSAIYQLFTHRTCCKTCSTSGARNMDGGTM